MSQFSEVDPLRILDQLRWRHYIVYWSANMQLTTANPRK